MDPAPVVGAVTINWAQLALTIIQAILPLLQPAPPALPIGLAFGDRRRKTGALPSPRHKLAAARPHAPKAVPSPFGVIPAQLSYWGNQEDGDCVSAEEAFAKAAYSLMMLQSELLIDEATLVAWARQHGYLNGATLTDVMDTMAKAGIAFNGSTYTDGPYEAVDWTDDATLRSAIYQGPVKIGIASAQLENVVGTANGWIATGFAHDSSEDHCVGLCGYGTLQDLCTVLKVSVPAGANPSSPSYLLFTWNTVGIIDQASLLAITGEAWLRTPTTPQTPIPGPSPKPVPIPAPTPAIFSGTLVVSSGLITTVTPAAA